MHLEEREEGEEEDSQPSPRRERTPALLTGNTLNPNDALNSSAVNSTLFGATTALLKSSLGVHALGLAGPEAALLEVSRADGAAHTAASESRGVERLVEEIGGGRSAGEGNSVDEDLTLHLLHVGVRAEVDAVVDLLGGDEVVVGHGEDEVV